MQPNDAFKPADYFRRKFAEAGVEWPEDAPIRFKGASFKNREIDRDQRLVGGLASTTDIDAEGEVVLAQAFDTSYFPDLVKTVFVDHWYDSLPGGMGPGAVGVCRNLAAKGNGLWAVTYVTRTGVGDDLLTLIDEGVIGGLSIGFMPGQIGTPTAEEASKYGPARSIVRTGKLLEYSFTASPANPHALLGGGLDDDAKSGFDRVLRKGLIHRSSAVAFGFAEAAPKAQAVKRFHLDDAGNVWTKGQPSGV